jgi:cation transport regulator
LPYESVADIPGNVRKNLKTPHEARIWLAAWNAAHEQYGDEQTAFAVALAAVEKYRAKKQKG